MKKYYIFLGLLSAGFESFFAFHHNPGSAFKQAAPTQEIKDVESLRSKIGLLFQALYSLGEGSVILERDPKTDTFIRALNINEIRKDIASIDTFFSIKKNRAAYCYGGAEHENLTKDVQLFALLISRVERFSGAPVVAPFIKNLAAGVPKGKHVPHLQDPIFKSSSKPQLA